MTIRNRFRATIDCLSSLTVHGSNTDGATIARACADFLEKLCVEEIEDYVVTLVSSDAPSIHRRMVSNPPALFDIDTYRGFMFELLFWYPLPRDVSLGDYVTEDIHDHFGYIASRMLRGPGYLERLFEKVKSTDSVAQLCEREFSEGASQLITPGTLHCVIYPHSKPSLSIRIVAPPMRGTMSVFDPLTLRFKESIICASERKAYELAGMLSLLCRDSNRLAACMADVGASVVMPEIRERMITFAQMGSADALRFRR